MLDLENGNRSQLRSRGRPMSNRTMQQKALKLRKQRRAIPKYLMKSGIIPNKGVLGEYKERAQGLGISEAEVDLLIKTLYKRDPIPSIPAGESKEIKALLKRLKEDIPEQYFFSVLDNCWHNTICFYNGQKTCFVMAHTDLRRQITRRSIEYGSKDRIMQAYYSDKIIWISCKSIRTG